MAETRDKNVSLKTQNVVVQVRAKTEKKTNAAMINYLPDWNWRSAEKENNAKTHFAGWKRQLQHHHHQCKASPILVSRTSHSRILRGIRTAAATAGAAGAAAERQIMCALFIFGTCATRSRSRSKYDADISTDGSQSQCRKSFMHVQHQLPAI